MTIVQSQDDGQKLSFVRPSSVTYNHSFKDKFLPAIFKACKEGELAYRSSLSLTSTLEGVRGQCHAPAALPSRKSSGTRVGGSVGLYASLDVCRDKHISFTRRGTNPELFFLRERERGHPVVYYQICVIYYVASIHNIYQDKMQ